MRIHSLDGSGTVAAIAGVAGVAAAADGAGFVGVRDADGTSGISIDRKESINLSIGEQGQIDYSIKHKKDSGRVEELFAMLRGLDIVERPGNGHVFNADVYA